MIVKQLYIWSDDGWQPTKRFLLMEEKSEICEIAIVKWLTNGYKFGVMMAENQQKDVLMEEKKWNLWNYNSEKTGKWL